ncbi:MAG: Yip1 family protein [Halobacteriaceae archaeon]
MRRLFTDPDGFIKQKAQMGGSIPAGILLTCAFVFALQPIVVYITWNNLGNIRMVREALIGKFFIEFLTVPVLWIGVSFLMLILARFLGGRPELGPLMRTDAYGFLPLIVAGLIWALGRWLAFSSYTVQQLQDAGIEEITGQLKPSMQVQFEVISGYVNLSKFGSGFANTAYTGSLVLGALFILPTTYLWYLSVKHTTSLDNGPSLIVAATPSLIYTAWLFGAL